MKKQIVLDRIIGIPLSIILAFFARILGKMLSPDHDISTMNIKNIAIFKFYGLGSIIQSIPSLQLLKKEHPSANIIFITKSSNKDIFSQISDVDKLVTIRDKNLIVFFSDLIRSLIIIWQNKIDLFFDLEVYSSFSTIYSTLSLARNRYGFYKKFTFYKTGLYTHLLYFNSKYHISEIYNRLFNLAEVPIKNNSPTIRLIPYSETLKKFNLLSQDYILINPNASDLMLNRKLPTQTWNRIIDILLETTEKKICLVGVQNEENYVKEILIKHSNDKIINTAGKTSIIELISIIQHAKLVVTIDSGIMHLAVATKVPTICLFGPGDPNHYGPNRKNTKVIYKNLYCSPCIYEVDQPPCKNDNQCMKQIKAEEILFEIFHFLSIDYQTTKPNIIFNNINIQHKYGELKT